MFVSQRVDSGARGARWEASALRGTCGFSQERGLGDRKLSLEPGVPRVRVGKSRGMSRSHLPFPPAGSEPAAFSAAPAAVGLFGTHAQSGWVSPVVPTGPPCCW